MALIVKNKDIQEYIQSAKKECDSRVYPKWKRLKVKQLFLEDAVDYKRQYIEAGDNPYVKNHDEMGYFGALLHDHNVDFGALLKKDKPFGVDPKFTSMATGYHNAGVLIYAPRGYVSEEPVLVDFTINRDNPTIISHNIIVADRDAVVKVIMRYDDELETVDTGDLAEERFTYYHVGVTKIFAHPTAKVQVVKVQDYSEQVFFVDNTVSFEGNDSLVSYNTIDLGGHIIATDYTAYLEGQGSRADIKTAYLGHGHQKLDIGFNLVHEGRHTDSLIEVKGALFDHARKVFRGNLKFERGSKRSKGSESEFVLLLDKTVHSDAIPALLCDEDDVSGEHAASSGQVDENKLFYLMSRGFSKREAIKLIVHGNFAGVLDTIDHEETVAYVEKRLETLIR